MPNPDTETLGIDLDDGEEENGMEVEDMSSYDDEPKAPPPAPRRNVRREMTEQAELSLKDWVESLGISDDFRIKITRKSPTRYMTDKGPIDIKGFIETVDYLISEQDIRDLYGGGTYMITLENRDQNGSFRYFKTRNVTIPGEPNLKHLGINNQKDGGSSVEAQALSAQAMATMKELVDRKNNGNSSAEIVGLLQTMISPITMQLQASQDAAKELQARIAEKDLQIMKILADQGKGDPEQSKLVERMWTTETGRLESIRAQHESELRVMRENHREDIKRLEQNHANAVAQIERAHEREIGNLQRAFDGQRDTMKMSYDSRIESLNREIDRLNQDMAAKSGELGELRAKKDMSIADKALEMSSIYESLGNMFGKGDEEPQKWYERLASVVVENPEMIKNIAGQVAPPAQLPPAQQQVAMQPQLPPPGTPFQVPGDNNVYVQDASGAVRQMNQEEIEQINAAMEEEARKPSAGEIKGAVMFMEAAIRNGTSPETFAESARSAIPADILRYIEAKGPDGFLDEMSQHLEPASPLRGQTGRNFVRKVAKYLLSGSAS